MTNHARIEELSDTDSDSDPPEADLDDLDPPALIDTANLPKPASFQPLQPVTTTTTSPPPDYKTYQCLYPLYFDALRTRSEGRRVSKHLAVPNPLARTIVDATQSLALPTVFEPGKTHPNDWANPGRVRVAIKQASSASRKTSKVKNKSHLYTLVAAYLQSHPTTPDAPLRLRVQGMPVPEGPLPAPAVPRGWKVGSILPLHSPAVSGGGVSENILKDVMQEMQGQGGGGMGGMASMLNAMGAGGNGSGGGAVVGGKRRREKEGKRR
ncbi:signal recognition particle subunit [Puttea exsequens]|nr:signal recognition particle subunit [Puttea exsequens]